DALSYVWGPSDKPYSLITSNWVILITESLHSVLHDLRLEDRHRCLWADGICINQEDSVEKSNQVALMGEIYKSCRHVLVYLGPQGEETDGAFDLIRAYWRKNMMWGISVKNLFLRPWFRRVWVVQEFILGR
ncbi:heterokaryon incompatibility, partial [Stipitochalara longipes BDJ]